jgi:hypothetical protein
MNKILENVNEEDRGKAIEQLTKIDWSDWDAME